MDQLGSASIHQPFRTSPYYAQNNQLYWDDEIFEDPQIYNVSGYEPMICDLPVQEHKIDFVFRSPSVVRHPLWCRWTLWYDGTKKQSKNGIWEDNLKEIYSFESAEDFWSVINNIHTPSQLPAGADYHLFKDGIKPMWEDPANCCGGKWILSLSSKLKDKLDTFWIYLLLGLIGENFSEGDEICGGVVSVRKQADRLSLWTKTATNRESALSIGQQFRDLLGVDASEVKLIYQAHEDALLNDSSYGNKPLYRL